MLLNPVVTTPTGALPPKRYSELTSKYFLQYCGDPTEYSASFAFDKLRCFSRIVPAFPVTLPFASMTTIWNSSNLPPLLPTYSDVVGLSVTVFHYVVVTESVPPTVAVVNESSC